MSRSGAHCSRLICLFRENQEPDREVNTHYNGKEQRIFCRHKASASVSKGTMEELIQPVLDFESKLTQYAHSLQNEARRRWLDFRPKLQLGSKQTWWDGLQNLKRSQFKSDVVLKMMKLLRDQNGDPESSQIVFNISGSMLCRALSSCPSLFFTLY